METIDRFDIQTMDLPRHPDYLDIRAIYYIDIQNSSLGSPFIMCNDFTTQSSLIEPLEKLLSIRYYYIVLEIKNIWLSISVQENMYLAEQLSTQLQWGWIKMSTGTWFT